MLSVNPMLRFPWPSKELALTPEKSLTLGKTILISFSRKSYILSPLIVTVKPISSPSLSLNVATETRAFDSFGFCPVIRPNSSRLFSIFFLSDRKSFMLVLTIILTTLGTAIGFLIPSRSWSF